MYIPFNDILNSPELFQNFVQTLAPSFTLPRYPNYLADKYSEDRKWQAVAAVNGRVPMASLIDRNDGKPIIGTEKPLDMNGTMPTFGNKVVFTSEEFNEIARLERAIMAKVMPNSQELIAYVHNYFQRLAVGPLKTIDSLFYEAFSNGTSTINAADNLGGLSMSINWQADKRFVTTVWSDAANATGIDDLKKLKKRMKDKYGVIVDRFTMNDNNVNLLLAQNSTKNYLSSYFGGSRVDIKWTGAPSLEAVNLLLTNNFALPPIVVDDYMISKYNADGKSEGTPFNAFMDGRVTAHVGSAMGQLLWTPADEQRRPDTGVVYQDVNHVLISKRSDRGKVTFESELNAIPVPTAMIMNQAGILVTDALS